MKLFTVHDASLSPLGSDRVAVLGYGSQGRAQSRNLRDSGINVSLGLRRGGASWRKALAEGWQPDTVAEAVAAARVVVVLVPDMVQPQLWRDDVLPTLQAGTLVLFSHGFNVHYDRLDLPPDVDVAMVAPKAPGALVRSQYQEGRGVPCLLAVHQDASGAAHARALAYAHALGGTRAGVLETTFAEETETDLFGEQAVLCGGATELIRTGWETLVEAGYSPEVAYFECLHELKLIVDLLYEGGFANMLEAVSETACFGDLTRGPRVVDDSTRERMREVLREIQSGDFAREWILEDEAGRSRYDALMAADLDHPLERVGEQLRARMTWLSSQTKSRVAA